MSLEFGLYLKNIRKARGLSLRELAGRSGIEFTRLSKIENGLRPPPDPNSLSRLARALEVTLSDMLRSSGLSEDILTGIASEIRGADGEGVKWHPGTVSCNPSGLALVKLDCGFELNVVTGIESGRVEVSIDPTDVILVVMSGGDFISSARNFFQAVVCEIMDKGSMARVILRHSSGLEIAADVTSRAVQEMDLAIDRILGVAFKAVACMIRPL